MLIRVSLRVMKMMVKGIVISMLFFGYLPDYVEAGDKRLNIQGKLTTSAGNPITGTKNLYFRLYDAESGGSPLWLEQQSVNLGSDGLFNVSLGSGTSLDGLAFDRQYYLGITVNGEEEMVPRQKLGSSPYAMGSIKDFSIGGSLALRGNIVFPDDQTERFIRTKTYGGAIRFRSNTGSPTDRKLEFGVIDNNNNWTSQMVLDTNNGNVGIGAPAPVSRLHLGISNNNGITFGMPHDPMNIHVPVGAETGRYNLKFYTWRDVAPDQIGAQISVVRTNNWQPNNALVQDTNIAFLTSAGWGNDLSEKMRITRSGVTISNGITIGVSGINAHSAQRTIQLLTQNGINGGTYDNHTGALIWSTLEGGGWGDARLKIALANDWHSYNTANPALIVGQNRSSFSGNVGIGTTQVANNKLRIVGGSVAIDPCGVDDHHPVGGMSIINGGAFGERAMQISPAYNNMRSGILQASRNASGAYYWFTYGVNNDGSFRINPGPDSWGSTFTIDYDGTVRIRGALVSYSTARFKKNIKKVEKGLELVKKLNGVSYDYIHEFKEEEDKIENGKTIEGKKREVTKHALGLIAEDVAKVIPEIVAFDENKNPEGIRYIELIAVLIEAIKEQDKRIEQLEQMTKSK